MEEELEVLDAILGQALKVEKDILRLTIQLEARLGQLTKLVWHQANLEEVSSEEKCLEVVVDYLPPVKLVIQLTAAYPVSVPPEGSIEADWLPPKERERLAMLLTQVNEIKKMLLTQVNGKKLKKCCSSRSMKKE